MTYDAARQRVVMYGLSKGSNPQSEVHEWDGIAWTRVADYGPAPRVGSAVAYRDSSQGVFLHGGANALESPGLWTRFDDAWEWSGSGWTSLCRFGPAPRLEHAVVYDQHRDRIVLFGGWAQMPFDDTWEWDGIGWSPVARGGPKGRIRAGMAYDPGRCRVVLFGGAWVDDIQDMHALGDTWEWNGMHWTQLSELGPSPRQSALMTYDDVRKRILLYGGNPEGPDDGHETWEWDGRHWTQVSDEGPAGAFGHTMAFDKARGCAVLLGDHTWEWVPNPLPSPLL